MTQCILFSARFPSESPAHSVIPAIEHLRRARLGRKRERLVVPRLYVGEKDENDGVQMMFQGKLLSLMLYWWMQVIIYLHKH